MSWLAAARKRVLEIWPRSASALARASSALSRVSSSVRSCTRRSSVSLARSSSSAAFTLGVMSVKVVTMPPSGMRLARTSITRSRSVKRSRNGALAERSASRRSRDQRRRSPRGRRACVGVEAQDLVERDADAHELARQVEDLAELPVPADQVQVLVEHRDALAHMVERGLQDFAVVVDRGVGVVEQLERRLGGHGALAQQQRQHQARRGGADRRGEQVLGVAQQLEVGLAPGVEADARLAAKLSNEVRVRSSPR